MNDFNIVLVKQLETALQSDLKNIENLLNTVNALSKNCKDTLFYSEYDFRTFNEYPSIKREFFDTAHHAAWNAFFQSFNLYGFNDNTTYNNMTKNYLFADTGKRNYYSGVKQLTPFTAENAELFFNEYLKDTKEKRKVLLDTFLKHCGGTYKTAPEKFSKKMTFRNLDVYGKCWLVAQFFQLCAYILGHEFDFNKFWTELRNNRVINGEAFQLVHGINIFIELHQNGNATIKIDDKDLIEILNKSLKD